MIGEVNTKFNADLVEGFFLQNTLREEIFAGINFREFFFADISREFLRIGLK